VYMYIHTGSGFPKHDNCYCCYFCCVMLTSMNGLRGCALI
jgi:hypothetical protein